MSCLQLNHSRKCMLLATSEDVLQNPSWFMLRGLETLNYSQFFCSYFYLSVLSAEMFCWRCQLTTPALVHFTRPLSFPVFVISSSIPSTLFLLVLLFHLYQSLFLSLSLSGFLFSLVVLTALQYHSTVKCLPSNR